MTSSSAAGGKRKRRSARKKQHTLKEVKALGSQLLSSRSHINNLPILLDCLSNFDSSSHLLLESLLSLHSFFTPILPTLPSSSKSNISSAAADPELVYRTWLRSKFDLYVQSLLDLSVSLDAPLLEVVLDTIMDCVKVSNAGNFNSFIYYRLLRTIVHSKGSGSLVELLISKYFKYIDIRYFTYISLEKLIRMLDDKDKPDGKSSNADANGGSPSESWEPLIHKIHHILSHIPPLEKLGENSEYEMWNGSGVFTNNDDSKFPTTDEERKKTKKTTGNILSTANVSRKMKIKFTKAWISFLKLALPVDVYKEVLVTLHQAVIPYISNPIMLCDFLTRSYDIGGVVSVMALSSLFVLMTEHGLEYPNFYEKLYALLEPPIFIAKHRAKFFQLLDSCLKSPLLPAYLAASFAKRLSRLALSVPPSGDLVIIALIHNLLRRHPSINHLVHQDDGDETTKDISDAEGIQDGKLGIDHFDNEESDLTKTNAMRSSLWEIDTLRNHYCPPVSRFVLSLENDLTVRAKTTEVAVKDFSSGSYATIFGEEIRRRVKQVPLAFYKSMPTSLFSESDFAGWTFCGKDDDNSKEVEDSAVKRQRVECL